MLIKFILESILRCMFWARTHRKVKKVESYQRDILTGFNAYYTEVIEIQKKVYEYKRVNVNGVQKFIPISERMIPYKKLYVHEGVVVKQEYLND